MNGKATLRERERERERARESERERCPLGKTVHVCCIVHKTDWH